LIFPPQWSPFQPFLSTPSLKAYLQGRGFHVRQSDWNVGFYSHFISAERKKFAIQRLDNYVCGLGPDYDAYRNRAILALGILSDYDAKKRCCDRLRSKDCVDNVEEFYASVTAFKRLLYAFSVAEPVVEVALSSLSTSNILSDLALIDDFCTNDEINRFLPYFRKKTLEVEHKPRYFGLSVIGTEVLVSLTLSRLLKSLFPDVPVLIGGSVLSRLVDKGDIIKHFFRGYFDAVVRYEGEEPLAQFLASQNPLSERTPNLCFLETDQLVRTGLVPQLPMTAIPTPDFDDLALDEYYSPEVVLPLLTTRGCY
jgi:hypothetical protein